MNINKCVICNKDFKVYKNHTRFCSLACEKLYDEKYKHYKQNINLINSKSEKNNFKILKCNICGTEFEAIRGSKKCCSSECKDVYVSDYNRDRYEVFRNANRESRRKMLVEKYSVTSANLYKLKAVCDYCLTEFYYDYSVFEKFNDTYVSHFNTTAWGVAVCPHCGLVDKSIYDEVAPDIHQIGDAELKLYLHNLRKNRPIILKKQAIYLKGGLIDFLSEAEYIRKQINRIKNKGELTQEEIDECIRKLFLMSK